MLKPQHRANPHQSKLTWLIPGIPLLCKHLSSVIKENKELSPNLSQRQGGNMRTEEENGHHSPECPADQQSHGMKSFCPARRIHGCCWVLYTDFCFHPRISKHLPEVN